MAKRRKRKAGLQKKVSSVFEGVSIPQRDGDPQISPKPALDGACGDLPRPMRAAPLVSQSSLMKKVCGSERSPDKAATDRVDVVLSERTLSDRPASPSSPTRPFHPAEEPPDNAVPDHTAEDPPKLTVFDHLIPQNSPVDEPRRAEDASLEVEPDRAVAVPPRLTAPDHPDSQSLPVKEPHQAENLSEGTAPSSTSWVPPRLTAPDDPVSQSLPVKEPHPAENVSEETAPSRTSRVPPSLTAPDHPIPQGSSATETEEAENVRDMVEPDRTSDGDPQERTAAEQSASRICLVKKLRQDEDASDTAASDRAAQAPPLPASPDSQMSEDSASEERHRPEVPPKEAAPSGRRETARLAAVGQPSLWQRIGNKLFAPKSGASPTRQKAMVILVPILAIILIFAFRQVFSKSPRDTKGATVEDAPVAAVADSGHEIDWQIPEPLPATMRDPTKLVGQIDTQSEEQDEDETVNTTKSELSNSELINIGPIVYSHDKPSAVVNGRISHVGDVINGVTILRIGRDSVECEKDGEKWIQKRRN